MFEQFEQFFKERQFISNVSPRTIQWYRESFAWLDKPEPTTDENLQPIEVVPSSASSLFCAGGTTRETDEVVWEKYAPERPSKTRKETP